MRLSSIKFINTVKLCAYSYIWEELGYELTKCDPLSENPALPANIEFELEAILSAQVVFQLNSDYCTKVLQGSCTVSY